MIQSDTRTWALHIHIPKRDQTVLDLWIHGIYFYLMGCAGTLPFSTLLYEVRDSCMAKIYRENA